MPGLMEDIWDATNFLRTDLALHGWRLSLLVKWREVTWQSQGHRSEKLDLINFGFNQIFLRHIDFVSELIKLVADISGVKSWYIGLSDLGIYGVSL